LEIIFHLKNEDSNKIGSGLEFKLRIKYHFSVNCSDQNFKFMWKVVVILIGISLALFCTNLKGKDVLDKLVAQRQKKNGRELLSYSIVRILTVDSTQKIFYISASVKTNSRIQQVSDTIMVYTTMDDILVSPAK
jgi:hypothetical protein